MSMTNLKADKGEWLGYGYMSWEEVWDVVDTDNPMTGCTYKVMGQIYELVIKDEILQFKNAEV